MGWDVNKSIKPFNLGLIALLYVFFASDYAWADTIYVSNYSNNTVEVFNSSGQGSVFASSGLDRPTGLALDGSGNLYVANNAHPSSLYKFGPDGQGSVFDNFWTVGPLGLAFDSSGNLFESLNVGWIVEFPSSGNVTTVPGTGGSAAIAFDNNGAMYGSTGNTIYKSNVLGIWGQFVRGSSPDFFTGLAFDRSGNLYAANYGKNTIEVFDPSGVGTVFASSGLNQPIGLAFGSDGTLYVANSGNNTIEEFDSSGHGSVFASSGLDDPWFIAVQPPEQIPEPATLALVVFGGGIMLGSSRLYRRLLSSG